MKKIYFITILSFLVGKISFEQAHSVNNTLLNSSYGNSKKASVNNRNLCLKLASSNSDKLSVRFYGRKKSTVDNTAVAAATVAGNFTIILLPDTQYYTAEPQGTNGGNNTMFKRQTMWIAKNRATRNIVYVGQLGDCTNDGDAYEVEWKRSDTAIRRLEDSGLTGLAGGIPYGICVGNHDQTPTGSAIGTTNFYNKYFGAARFKGRSYYGGHCSTNNDNFYELFSVGNYDFLVICFEYDPTTAFTATGGALDWGESIIKSYPKRNVIVLSHYVLKAGGSFSVQGNNIYQRFKNYPNFKLMSGGHVPDSVAEAVRSDTYNGNTVYTVLSNYQGRPNGGNGLLRIYQFDPANNVVSVKTYSPYTGAYETDANSQFTMNISLIPNNATLSAEKFDLISESKQTTPGAEVCANWSSLEKNATYEWYAEVTDGSNKIKSATWNFSTTNDSVLQTKKEFSVMFKPKESFIVYPNPNKTNKLFISFDTMIKGKVSIKIFNVIGSCVLQKILMNVDNNISFEHNLSSGIYTVLVQTERGKGARKLVVAK